jgi:DNA-binding MarR family transcriptional regulator
MSEDSSRQDAARSVLAVLPIVMRTVGRAMRESGSEVSPPQHRLLTYVANRPRTLSEVARIQGVTPATATTLVTTLENHGWVSRTPDVDDRRRVVVSLTDAGRASLEHAQSVAENAMTALLEPLGPEDLDRLVEGIDILRRLGSPDSEICR